MSNKKFSKQLSGKGYYIALILCAVAIGISGYLYYRNAQTPDTQLHNPNASVAATVPQQDVPAVATQPNPEGTTGPSGTDKPVKPVMPRKTASPLAGDTVTPYAMDCLSYNQTTRDWRVHNGVDIAAEAGTKVCAAADGTVYTVYEDETMGKTVVIRHEGGYTTKYSSLADAVLVKPGETVKLGQAIGCVGDTALVESAIGCHVHFSVSCNDVPVDPADFI